MIDHPCRDRRPRRSVTDGSYCRNFREMDRRGRRSLQVISHRSFIALNTVRGNILANRFFAICTALRAIEKINKYVKDRKIIVEVIVGAVETVETQIDVEKITFLWEKIYFFDGLSVKFALCFNHPFC